MKNQKQEFRHIAYSFAETPFGKVIIAFTPKGICKIAFVDDEAVALVQLRKAFPGAMCEREADAIEWKSLTKAKLHLKGTPFQLKVWEALRKIPAGKLSTYGEIAKRIGQPTACRAVGTAIGKNPVALLVPCHRVIHSSGALGSYHWGADRKAAIIRSEADTLQEG